MSLNTRKISEVPIYPSCMSKSFPNFKKPKVCGYFSINKDRQYINDLSHLKYFYYPALDPESENLNLDLNKGFEFRKPKDDSDEKINNLLDFIIRNFAVLRHGSRQKM